MPADRDDARRVAEAFEALFGQVYLHFHRRDGKRSQLSASSRAVLTHLAFTGPLTVGEAAVHLDRAQSVVSEIVSRLERAGLLERETDPGNRRRTLIWLTEQGFSRLREDREVLAPALLARAFEQVPAGARAELLAGLRALLDADLRVTGPDQADEHHQREEPR